MTPLTFIDYSEALPILTEHDAKTAVKILMDKHDFHQEWQDQLLVFLDSCSEGTNDVPHAVYGCYVTGAITLYELSKTTTPA